MERMISLERCRKILGSNDSVSDENLAALREQLYSFAELALDIRDRKQASVLPSTSAFEQLADEHDEPDILRERAAIIEFDGKVSRDEAERMTINLELATERIN
jgi:hypothetical protein